jgi:hypothetical protein
MNIYISIGAQCTTPTLFKSLEVKKESLPFDWMFSTPEFVFTIIKLLLIDKMEIDHIVDNYFFACDKKAIHNDIQQQFITDDNGTSLINTKYNVCFPHDNPDARDKYIRRMERLKKIILNQDNFIYFVYVSVSSLENNNYAIDGCRPIIQLYEYIEKLNTIMKSIRTNYKIVIFDTNKNSNAIPSDDLHMAYYNIEEKYSWGELLPELVEKCNDIIINKSIH